MIELQNLCCSYGKNPVLQNLNLICPDGSITALLGVNGAGKTTAVRCLQGALPYCGTVLLDGSPAPRDRSKLLSVLPQVLPSPALTVEELVLLGRTPYLGFYGIPGERDKDIVQSAMERMNIAHLSKRKVNTLSGGQRQNTFLAMLLAQDTQNVIFDEPSTFMDAASERAFYDFAQELRTQGKCILLILHQLDRALNHADRLAVLDGGALRFHGSDSECVRDGVLSELFGVTVHRFPVEGKEQYFCS